MTDEQLIKFIWESDKIEGISRTESMEVFYAYESFLALGTITITDLEQFVSVIEPGAKLRDQKGMNVHVGNHIPPPGGAIIATRLAALLTSKEAYRTHLAYEHLHPFTDGNGRSGRAYGSGR